MSRRKVTEEENTEEGTARISRMQGVTKYPFLLLYKRVRIADNIC
jgi:hypothetical protein